MEYKKKIVFIFLALIGTFLFILGFYLGFDNYKFVSEAQKTEGEIIDFKKSTRGFRGGSMYAPIVKYKMSDGKEKIFTSLISSSPSSFAVGDKVIVAYTDQRSEVNSFGTLYVLPIGFFSVGLFLSIIGISGITRSCRSQYCFSAQSNRTN